MTVKLNYLIFALTIITGITIRSVMLLYTVDPISGFIKAEYAFPATFIIIFLVAAAVIVFLSGTLFKTTSDTTPNITGIPFAVSCILMAVALGYETFFSSLLSAAGTIQRILQHVFAAAAILSLIYIAVCKLIKRDFPPIISVVPVAFWIMRLIVIFTEFSTISTISDTVIETSGMCLALLTFLFYAKIECAQPSKYHKLFFATSLLCAYVSAISSVPRIIANILSVGQAIHLNTVPTSTALATAVFSTVFAYTLLKCIKR